jgi:hypothetical protein
MGRSQRRDIGDVVHTGNIVSGPKDPSPGVGTDQGRIQGTVPTDTTGRAT